MYSPLNEDFMFEQMRAQAERLKGVRGGNPTDRGLRRWWRR